MAEASGSKPRKFRKKQENNGEDAGDSVKEKKPFDKARWREKQYSKKYKVDQWQERRKKAALDSYHRALLKDDKTAKHPGERFKKAQADATYDSSRSRLAQAQAIYHRRQQEKNDRFAQIELDKAQRAEALAKYKARKADRFKKLSAKTKSGQPLMRGRIELMLEEIEEMVKKH